MLLETPNEGRVPGGGVDGYMQQCRHKAYFPLGGKFLSQKSSFVCKHDSAQKLNGYVAFLQINQMTGKSRCERNVLPGENQVQLCSCLLPVDLRTFQMSAWRKYST